MISDALVDKYIVQATSKAEALPDPTKLAIKCAESYKGWTFTQMLANICLILARLDPVHRHRCEKVLRHVARTGRMLDPPKHSKNNPNQGELWPDQKAQQ